MTVHQQSPTHFSRGGFFIQNLLILSDVTKGLRAKKFIVQGPWGAFQWYKTKL